MPKYIKLDSRLTPQQKQQIQQVVATMDISGMPVSEESIRDMEAVALGLKTHEQVIQETIKRYQK